MNEKNKDKIVNKHVPVLFQSLDKFESEDEDVRFQKVKIWLCHTGENLNGSYFSKDSIEKAKPSLANTPILAYIEENRVTGDKDFSDHREVLIRQDGDVTTKYLGKAIGVIPSASENNAQFEMRLCDDGETREYLTVEGLLWTKFDDSTDIMSRDVIKSQSMELGDKYTGHWEEDNLFHFDDFQFYGACGLGYGVTPAMKNSTIELQFSVKSFEEEVNNMMETFKNKFSSSQAIEVENENKIIDNKVEENFSNKEEEKKVKTKTEIASKFALTTMQLYEELNRELGKITYKAETWYGEEVDANRYYMNDFDEAFVYAVDREDGYKSVKIPYTKDGDDVTFNTEGVVRVKYVPTDWEQGSEDDTETDFAVKVIAEVEAKAKEKFEAVSAKVTEKETEFADLTTKFEEAQNLVIEKEATITELNGRIASLKEFEVSVKSQERKDKVEALFTKLTKSFTQEEITEWTEKEATYETFEAFEKDIKAFAYDRIVESKDFKKEEPKQEFSMTSIKTKTEDNTETEVKSVWTKIKE